MLNTILILLLVAAVATAYFKPDVLHAVIDKAVAKVKSWAKGA